MHKLVIVLALAAAFTAGTSVGASVMIAAFGVIVITRYLSLGALAGAAVYAMITVLAVDDALVLRLALFTVGLVILRHIPSIIRLVRRTEPRLSLKEDITYKLDE